MATIFDLSCSSCKFQDPATSTVRVNLESLDHEEIQRREAYARQKADQLAAEVLAELQADEEVLAAEVAEEQREEAKAPVAAAESDTAAAKEASGEEQEEAERLSAEREAREARLTAIHFFLKQHGFSSVHSVKRSLFGQSTYPLHKAAELGNSQIASMLLLEGADPTQKNSSSKTAAEVAKKKDKSGSHAKVYNLLVDADSYAKVSHGGA